VAFASLAMAFCIMGLMFLLVQKTLQGTKQLKGALFGIALGGMYLIGMMEAYVTYPVSLFGEFYCPVYQRPLPSVDHCRVNPKAGSWFGDIISVPALYD